MHLGQIVKEVFDKSDLSVVEFSRRINVSRENVYSIFKRPSMDVFLLARISIALNHNFFTPVIPQMFLEQYDKEIEDIKQQMMVLEREKDYLTRINDLHKEIENSRKKSN